MRVPSRHFSLSKSRLEKLAQRGECPAHDHELDALPEVGVEQAFIDGAISFKGEDPWGSHPNQLPGNTSSAAEEVQSPLLCKSGLSPEKTNWLLEGFYLVIGSLVITRSVIFSLKTLSG